MLLSRDNGSILLNECERYRVRDIGREILGERYREGEKREIGH